jgi:hypothetical protein
VRWACSTHGRREGRREREINTYRILVGKLDVKRLLGRSRCRGEGEDNNRILYRMGWYGLD